jgi:ABC-type bacteriocin/lantibiotic exporter with double-glycine peptidase domain
VVAGLVVVGALVLLALLLLAFGLTRQRAARRAGFDELSKGRVGVEWVNVSYTVPSSNGTGAWFDRLQGRRKNFNDDKVVLDSVNGHVQPGKMMAILGPSGKLFFSVLLPLETHLSH